MLIITTLYSLVSFLMWVEMRKSRIKHEVPELSIRLIQKEATEYDIEISNQSNSEIYDLKFSELPKLEKMNPQSDKIGFLKNGVTYMCKGQKYRSSFLRTTQYIEEIQNPDKNFDLVFKYSLYDKPSNFKNRNKFEKEIRINISLIMDTRTRPMFEIGLVDEIKKLNTKLKEFVDCQKQLTIKDD